MYLKSCSSFACLFKVLRGSFSSSRFCDKTALILQSYRLAHRINASSSGEIFKENFTDIFYTNFEQIAFSLDAKNSLSAHKQNKNLLANQRDCTCTFKTAMLGKYKLCDNLKREKCSGDTANVNPQFASPLYPRKSTALRSPSCFTFRKASKGFDKAKLSSLRLRKMLHQKYTNLRFVSALAHQFANLVVTNRLVCSSNALSKQRERFVQQPANVPLLLHASCSSPYPYKSNRLQTLTPSVANRRFATEGVNKKRSHKLKTTPISLNIKIGDYLSSGDKIGEKNINNNKISKNITPVVSFLHKNQLLVQPAMRVLSYKPSVCKHVMPYKSKICSKYSICKHSLSNLSICRALTEGLANQSFAQPTMLQEGTLLRSTRFARAKQLGNCLCPYKSDATTNRRFVRRFATDCTKGACVKICKGKSKVKSKQTSICTACPKKVCNAPSCNTYGDGPSAQARQKAGSTNTKVCKQAIPIILTSSGRVVVMSKAQLIVQKTQPVLFYDSANLHVKKGELVSQGAPVLTLTHQTLITGDIVQGIPRIEQLFEAFTSPQKGVKDRKRINVHDTLHSQVRDIFRKNWLKNVLSIAVRKSLEEIQSILLEMLQKVYLSQGVLISDKHIEIIIRQMTSKGQILDSGSTGLLLEEILPLRQIENANITTPGKKCLYVPSVVGLTAASLTCDSFISAASFQETTRVLSRDAVVGKSDFLRGLKEKVVIGDLISAGTGLEIYFIYTLFSQSI